MSESSVGRIGVAGLLLAVVGACAPSDPAELGPGVTRTLAERRAAAVSELRYELHLELPERREQPVTGEVTLRFEWLGAPGPLVLDFRAPADHVLGVTLDGDSASYHLIPDHIVVGEEVPNGSHTIRVRFRSTDAALNRGDDFLYALFVPDRASTAFPVFEQPDLKARVTLALTIPAAWEAIANGSLVSRDSTATERHTLHFAESAPISTYLMTFAAGRLKVEQAVRDGRTLTMYHRETDAAKVARNREAIFDLHAAALKWLEAYTGIAYPFEKFAFFAVPSFQFGGMEHPGAVWYNANGLFLDQSASRAQELGRASVIAHETAHMWFGDLVTMRWFNDVWMKEVFANFYAAKIAGPSFPDVNLRLRFFQAHHPGAYGVDRTAGANPIRQDLDNLREAGSLYGAIIYQKAPIVMQQLETLVGEEAFRAGIRQYLSRYRYGNAAWPDLIAILDELTPVDLVAWSRVWVEESGRPTITAAWRDSGLVVTQTGRRPQPLTFALGYGDSVVLARGSIRSDAITLALADGLGRPEFILGGADGVGYGRFPLDSTSREALLAGVGRLNDPVHRAVAWQALQEEMLDGLLSPARLLEAALREIPREKDELVVGQIVGLLRGTFWRFLPPAARYALAPAVEAMLWRELDRAPTPGRKGTFFSALVGMSLTSDGVKRLERIWRKEETPKGLPISEQQYTGLAEALVIRGLPNAPAIIEAEAARITNPDRKARFAFIRPALSADPAIRDAFFLTLAKVENRRRESWVLDAMSLMHHPLRESESLAQLPAVLEVTEEIQRTGDIFFPLRWLNAALDGHQSTAAATTVRDFLAAHPDYPPRLRGKLLQAADDLYRAARIVEGWETT